VTTPVLLSAMAAAVGVLGAATLLGDLFGGWTSQIRLRWPLRARLRQTRPDQWRRLKLFCAGLSALAAVPTFTGSSLRVLVLLTATACAAGYIAPDLWLARQSRRRIEAALRDLPDMLDLLRVAVAAGAPPLRALALVASEFPGPLASEWQRVSAAAELGLPQDRALSTLLERVPHDDTRTFVDTLRRGHRHGTPLAAALAALAGRARHARAQQMRERAARAGPKIQLVVALVLVPSVLLLLVAGVVAELGRAGLLISS
jgi:tight adherence protein C